MIGRRARRAEQTMQRLVLAVIRNNIKRSKCKGDGPHLRASSPLAQPEQSKAKQDSSAN